jgi:PAS domain S-box-containing protein
MVWLSIACSLLYCVGDALLQSAVYHEGSFLRLLLSPPHASRVERPAVAVLLVSFGVLAQVLRQRQRRSEAALATFVQQSRERERTVAESGEFLAKIVNAIDDPFFVKDAQHRRVRVNKAYCALLGRTEEQLLGKSDFDLHPREVACRFTRQDDQVLAALEREGKLLVEEQFVDAAGGARVLSVNKQLYRDARGQRFVVGIARDVTDLKLMESLIFSAKTEWEETFNTIDEAITVHDCDYTIVSANRAAEQLFSLPLQSLLGQKCCRIYHGRELPPPQCSTCAVASTGAPLAVSFFEPHLGRHLEINAMPRRGSDGRISGVIHVVRDVTERLRVQGEQRRLEEHLQQAQKIESIGRLAGGVAHDFNNIIGAILGYSELALLKLPPESPVRATVAAIKESGDRAAALTGQLLAFSRRQVLQVKPLEMNAVVTGVAALLQRMIGEDVVLEVRPGAAAGVVRADRHQIEQILINLAVNSRDAMPDGGRLVIETDRVSLQQDAVGSHPGLQPGEYVLLTVGDSGCGMSDEVKRRIFEPFFTTKPPGSGTGLGLATVYGIVKQHQGFIYLDSAPGDGTTFRVYLPAVLEAAPAAAAAVAPAASGSGLVLVVDDDVVLRSLVCETLAALGYTALEAADAEAAARVVAGHPGGISLLLTDVVMPGANGRELARHLCALDPGLRVLFMSGYTDDVTSRHGVLEPGLNFLAKPFDQAALSSKIREVLGEGGERKRASGSPRMPRKVDCEQPTSSPPGCAWKPSAG